MSSSCIRCTLGERARRRLHAGSCPVPGPGGVQESRPSLVLATASRLRLYGYPRLRSVRDQSRWIAERSGTATSTYRARCLDDTEQPPFALEAIFFSAISDRDW